MMNYRALAESAERRAKECKRKAKSNPAYEKMHDDAMAEFYYYNKLQDLLGSGNDEQLLEQLKVMKNTNYDPPGVFDQKHFKSNIDAAADGAIKAAKERIKARIQSENTSTP